MKKMIRGAARALGYDLRRHVDQPERPFDVLRYVVEDRLRSGRGVRFVQLGANDGVADDPLRPLVLAHGLQGILVEPIPDLFDRLRANYAGQPGLAFERCAVGDRDGEATLYRFRPSPDLPEWFERLASFDRKRLEHRVQDPDKHIEAVSVPVLTLPSLLRKHGMGSCDLLQVDTEGFDCQIVRWALEAGLRPAIINYEFIHAKPEDQARCKRLLAELGYEFLDVGRDTLAIREGDDASEPARVADRDSSGEIAARQNL